MKITYIAMVVAGFTVTGTHATTVSTGFGEADGFVTGGSNAVTVDSLVTFSGGQQQQMFDMGSYEAGPAGYLFVNTGGGSSVFTGSSGNSITGGVNNGDSNGLISILGGGATEVSFYAADRANGVSSSLNIFGVDGSVLLGSVVIPSAELGDVGTFFEFDSATLGGNIGSIGFDLAGPAANPPYVVAIDTFTAEVAAIPEPSSAILAGLALGASFLRRRR